MKKLGCVIIMHDGQNNYGTSLQGFATAETFRGSGTEFEIIRYIKQHSILFKIKTTPLYLLSGGLRMFFWNKRKHFDELLHPKYRAELAIRTRAVNSFKKRHFEPITRYFRGWKAVCDGSRDYSACMVGSDQVWGPLSLYAGFYNLLFVDDRVPKFSYASSFGVSKILPWQRKGFAEYLGRIDKVGVREAQGKSIVESLTEQKAKVVLDPTFLLTQEQWRSHIATKSQRYNEPYILCYILGTREDIRNNIREIGKQAGMKVVFLRHIDEYISSDESVGDCAPYDVDPLDFVALVRDAAYVITDSFHGSVFSIVFEKNFLTYYRHATKHGKSTHSRIDNLLGLFGLHSRIADSAPDKYAQLCSEIDYSAVRDKLATLREDSLGFLRECLALAKQ